MARGYKIITDIKLMNRALEALADGRRKRVYEIRNAVAPDYSNQKMVYIMRILLEIGKVKREVEIGERTTASAEWNGSVYTWEYEPKTVYYSLV